ncbi:hypothetical protein Tcan_06019 [Toxocara canis]|uniref:Uncharacterized protein n=1 Tax=Toxocara canis TaxID=6265 RepID=A0A0B2V676_TOXCA|nr:hypothetical protein Tcan_06019 [Toxocara canis]
MSAYFNQESSRFSSFPSDSFSSPRGMTQWQNSARGGAEREFRGDVIGNYGRASSYGRGMPMEDGYGGGECRTEWGARYGAEPSRAPFYDAAEDESWRPAREEGSWRDLHRERCGDSHHSRDFYERRPRRSVSPQRRRPYGGSRGMGIGERCESFDSRYKTHAHSGVDARKAFSGGQQRTSLRSRHQTKGSPKEQKSDSMEVKQEGGVTSVTRDPKESTAKVNKSGDDAEPKKKEVAKIVEEDIEGNADSGARKIASLEKGDKWKDDKDEKRNEEKQGVEHHSEADETFGKIEVGKEEDPAKKIFIRKDFTHDDIHHFVPISMRERGFSKGSSAPHTTKQKRWIDEWKERNAALKAVADAKLSPESGALKQCISASGGGGDETKDVSADADSIGIIDPKDYIEALSNPDFDPPQPDDLAADLMPKEAEETVKGRRTLLSPPVLAERAEDKAGMGFFSVPVLAGPSMFKAQENTEPERPFKPGLLDPDFISASGGGGDETKDVSADADSIGIIDPKDYIEALSNPDFDPPQPDDLAADLMPKEAEETVKGRRTLLSPPVLAERAEDKAGMGFFSVPVLAGPSMFKAQENTEPERPFKPGLLDPPPRVERPPKPGLLDVRMDAPGLKNGPVSKSDRLVLGGTVAVAMRATVDAIADSLPQRGVLSDAVKRGVTEMLLSNDGFTAEIAKLCKEEVARMLTRGLNAGGRRTPPRPGGFAYEDSSLPFHWERDGEPCSLGSRRGQGPIDRFCGDRRGYERRPSYDGPRNGTHGPPRLPRWLVSKGNFAEDFGGVSTAVGMMTSTSSSNFTE